MATGNEKRLPVLQAIVSTSVNAKLASCGEREANAVFISPGSVLDRLMDVYICMVSHASFTTVLMSDCMTMKHSCCSLKATIFLYS